MADKYCYEYDPKRLKIPLFFINLKMGDCTGDGKIDCDDFATIHKTGGYGCKGVPLPEPYGERYRQCKQIVGQLKP